MARINALGMNDILNDIEKDIKRTPEISKKMLEAGADVLVSEIKHQIKAYNIWELGTTHDSIKKRSVKYRGNDELYIEVWPAGTRRDQKHPKGERVETVAFIAEYGTSSIAPRPFMSTAIAVGEEKVVERMTQVWEAETK